MQEPTRRSFLLMSIAFLTGCATDQATLTRLPGPPGDWGNAHDPIDRPTVSGSYEPVFGPNGSRETVESTKSASTSTYALPAGVIARSTWAKGSLIPSRMNKMTTIKRITVHHDGMRPFYASTESASQGRLDNIRRSHLGRGWGDVGYHYIIDRAGRTYEGRPLQYQGAHVKFNNPGNIGVMCMGNFDEQSPTQAQLSTLNTFLTGRVKAHAIPAKNILTHQELRPTACPGTALQRHMTNARNNGLLA